MQTDRSAETRVPTALQGWLLVSGSWLAVMAPAIIAPILPRMTAAFQGVSRESVLIALAATLPALFVALLALPSGVLVDRLGSRKLLLVGLAIYAVVGTAPLWLTSLPAIVASRACVGVAEAFILTSSTVLLGDYFAGDQRAKWLALQTGSANIVAVGMNLLSGTLGEHSWRTPFFVYGISLLQVPLVAALIWTPHRAENSTIKRNKPGVADLEGSGFRWNSLVGICLVTIFASTAFYLVVVQLGFLLSERGVHSPKLIGRAVAISVLSLPLGAYLSRLLRIPYLAKMAISFTLSALGFVVVALARTYGTSVLGGVITDLGSGIALTTLITWALSGVPGALRGRATGAWQASFAFGQFASPLVVVGLMRLVGARWHAVMVYGVLCGISAVLTTLMLTLRRNAPAVETSGANGSVLHR